THLRGLAFEGLSEEEEDSDNIPLIRKKKPRVITSVVKVVAMQTGTERNSKGKMPVQVIRVSPPVHMPQVPEPPENMLIPGASVVKTQDVKPGIQEQKEQMAPQVENPVAPKAGDDKGVEQHGVDPEHERIFSDLLKDLEVDQGVGIAMNTSQGETSVEKERDPTHSEESKIYEQGGTNEIIVRLATDDSVVDPQEGIGQPQGTEEPTTVILGSVEGNAMADKTSEKESCIQSHEAIADARTSGKHMDSFPESTEATKQSSPHLTGEEAKVIKPTEVVAVQERKAEVESCTTTIEPTKEQESDREQLSRAEVSIVGTQDKDKLNIISSMSSR
ncbi:hypothetical protein KI387_036654, partial [Taxus chinensis]